jgi:hypothetical protein
MVGRASEGREGVVVDTAKERVFGPLVAAQHGGRETEHWKFYHKFKVYGSRNKVSLPRPQHQPQRRKPVTTIMLAQVASATLYCKRGKKGKREKKRGGKKREKKTIFQVYRLRSQETTRGTRSRISFACLDSKLSSSPYNALWASTCTSILVLILGFP